MKLKIMLTTAAIATFIVILAANAKTKVPLLNNGLVYVYHVYECDNDMCSTYHEIHQQIERTFESMDACTAYATIELNASRDVKRGASCNRMWES